MVNDLLQLIECQQAYNKIVSARRGHSIKVRNNTARLVTDPEELKTGGFGRAVMVMSRQENGVWNGVDGLARRYRRSGILPLHFEVS